MRSQGCQRRASVTLVYGGADALNADLVNETKVFQPRSDERARSVDEDGLQGRGVIGEQFDCTADLRVRQVSRTTNHTPGSHVDQTHHHLYNKAAGVPFVVQQRNLEERVGPGLDLEVGSGCP